MTEPVPPSVPPAPIVIELSPAVQALIKDVVDQLKAIAAALQKL
jgi:hypothetical protein